MPIYTEMVTELNTHVFGPVAEQSIRKLLVDLDIADIVYGNIAINTDSEGVTTSKDSNYNAKMRTNRIESNVSLNLNPINVPWQQATFKHSPGYGLSRRNLETERPVFRDLLIRTSLYEHNLPTSMVINLKIILLSMDMAHSVSSALYTKYNDGNIIQQEHLFFDYHLPDHIKYLLYHFHKYKCIGSSTPLDLNNYLRAYSDNQIGFVVNKADLAKIDDLEKRGKKPRTHMVVRKAIPKVLVKIEHTDDQPEAERDGRAVQEYIINCAYTIQFPRPSAMHLDYPIIVNNQVLPNELIPRKSRRIHNLATQQDTPVYDQYNFQWKNNNTPSIMQFPIHDDWTVPFDSVILKNKCYPVVICAFTLDEDDQGKVTGKTILPLDGDFIEDTSTGDTYRLHEIIKEIVTHQGNDTFDLRCLFNIALFRNNITISPEDISMDKDLNVTLNMSDRFDTYHMVVSCQCDVSNLYPNHIPFYQKYLKNNLKGDPYGILTAFRSNWANFIVANRTADTERTGRTEQEYEVTGRTRSSPRYTDTGYFS